MKKLVKHILVLFLIAILAQAVALEKSEEIEASYKIDSKQDYSEVRISNINGSISVESYKGSEVKIIVNKYISANNQSDLNRGLENISLKVYEHEKGIFIYMDHPCANFDKENLKLNYDCGRSWSRDNDFNFKFDFEVMIPQGVSFVKVGTVNKGDIFVKNLKCDLVANNVNGAIEINNHEGNVDAHTVNGDVDVYFDKNPDKSAYFHTINGDINTYCKNNLSANIQFESMNGEFYTDFEISGFIPTVVKTNKKSKRSSTKYSLKSIKRFNIDNGDAEFKFKTLNGNMYLRKNK